ncbi:alpha/beta hydrolase [Acinetobacter pittii]|nr:alpha/beta hydrolase [Acinetobacter pittii]MCG9483418.1 alpha/beta hydrolase [Acinetobacter pittii]
MAFVHAQDGTEIYYEDQGKGENLVFISGYMGIADIWHNQIDTLKSRYRCITHDNRGYGRSGKPEHMDMYSIEIHAEDLKAILDATEITDPVTLITHSMGGNIATAFTLKYPEKVKSIIYTGTHLSGTQFKELGETADTLFDGVSTSIKSVGFFQAFGLTPDICLEAAKWSRFSLLANAYALANYDPQKRYDEIQVPVLIIQGANDVVTPANPCATELQKMISGSQLEILNNVNHFPQTEAPDRVTFLIENFLEKLGN